MSAAPLPPRPLLVGVVATAALVGLLGAGLLALGGGPLTGGGEGTPPATPAPVPTADTPAVPGLERVPGVDATGITDPAALGPNYTIWADLYWRPANATGGWTQRDIDITVDGGQSLLRAEVERAPGGARRPALSVYTDGDVRYVADYGPDGLAEYRRLPAGAPSPARVPDPAALRQHVPAGLLTVSDTRATGIVERDGETFSRVVGQGKPAVALPTPGGTSVAPTRVRNYSVVLLVDGSGRVDTIEARYTLPERLAPRTVRFRLSYDRIGATVVRRPGWVVAVPENRTRTATPSPSAGA